MSEHEEAGGRGVLGGYGLRRRQGRFTGLGSALLVVALILIGLVDVALLFMGHIEFVIQSTLLCAGLYFLIKLLR